MKSLGTVVTGKAAFVEPSPAAVHTSPAHVAHFVFTIAAVQSYPQEEVMPPEAKPPLVVHAEYV